MPHSQLLSDLFRKEYAKMVAALCRHFGFSHLEIAEDIASDTFLKAYELWETEPLPPNPTAWLYTVAKNKAKDYEKHVAIFEDKVKKALTPTEKSEELTFETSEINDSQLEMLFNICDPSISVESQISLALQILCGFTVEEIANALLTHTETIKKRLLRAKSKLREHHFQIKTVSPADIQARLETVLRCLYLFFNEGYFSETNNQFIRREFCKEALRLTLLLAKHPQTDTPQVNALLSLMCFQSSRLEARINTTGENTLYEQQDKSKWDKELIHRGNYYLVKACEDSQISKYHLEAGIAYWHTTPTDENKWEYILRLYNQLIIIEYSSVIALNRTFAYGKVYGKKKAIVEAEKLGLQNNRYYHELLGYLYTDINNQKAIAHYQKAIALSKSANERATLQKQIEQLVK